MALTQQQVDHLTTSGGSLVGTSGAAVGDVVQVYRDDQTSEPTWVTVRTSAGDRFVPLSDARVQGSTVMVPFDAAVIADAPAVAADGSITPEEEAGLHRYYAAVDRPATGAEEPTSRREAEPATRPGTDDAVMTRSEERLRVGVQRRARERVRFVKQIVSEEVTQTVTVRREELRVVREPVSDTAANSPAPSSSTGENDLEIVLYAERPVTRMEIVPVERVRVHKELVTDQITVSEDVRQERIDTQVDGPAGGR